MKHLILATAGHVDHGKSALVRELTGVDPDRLPEEKARGITIDLGFAELVLAPPLGGEETHLGLIDVPGHEDFVRNMVAGVGSVDLALLAVAADDGWMRQTEEHLQILTYLGVRHMVVALTKSDLISDEDTAATAVRERLGGTPFADAPIVPTAISRPQTMAELRAVLAEVCAQVPQPQDIGKPRLAVDRAFRLHGVGTIVTGTLTGGGLKRGDAVTIQPWGGLSRIRALQSHGRDLTEASPGRRVALNLTDMPVAAPRAETGVRRGDVIAQPDAGAASERLDVQLAASARLKRESGRPLLRSGAMVRIHHGSSSMPARVRFLEAEDLYPGENALARLHFASPLFAFIGDRLIVRDSSGSRTLAGGIVLDAGPPPNPRHPQLALLRTRAAEPGSCDTLIQTQLTRDGAVRSAELLSLSRFSRAELDAAMQRLCASGAMVLRRAFAADAAWWRKAMQRAGGAIDEQHRVHPERPGLSLAQLRAVIGFAAPDLAEAMVSDLCANGYVRAGALIQRAAYRPTLPPALQAAGARIRAALSARPFEPPSRKDLGTDPASLQALRFLVESGDAVEIGETLAMATPAFEQAKQRVARHLRERGPATAGELREALGTSRRVVVPLLERFDQDGLTRRLGDKRVLRSGCSGGP